MRIRHAVCALAVACFPALLCAQTSTASIVGFVHDVSGAPVSSAGLKVRSLDTNEVREEQTDSEGGFTVTNLAPGPYEIDVGKTGFKALHEKKLELEVDQTARLDLKLEIGAVTDSVEVMAEAAIVNTESATRGEVIVAREMTEVPLDGRDFGDLAFLVPGVGRAAQGGQGTPYVVNGARGDNVNFIIDGFNDQNPRGGNAQARPNIDAMQEFKVQTTGYSAEYGRLAGGVISMVIKSGTNQFDGALFEFVRNDFSDARNFFDDRKSELRRNQFGGTIGGPLSLPKLYSGRNRTFFLASWESQRQVQGAARIGTAPTLLERAGDFSQSVDAMGKPILLHDPFAKGACTATSNAACFAGNRIPASRFSPIANKLLNYYPLPRDSSRINNYLANVAADNDFDSYLFKVDHQFSGGNNVSVRFLDRFNNSSTPYAGSDVPLFGSVTHNTQTLAGINFTHLFSATWINEARLGFTRTNENDKSAHAGQDFAAQLGIAGVTTDPHLVGFPRFTATGLVALGDQNTQPSEFAVNNYELADTATLVRGKHLMKFGADVLHTQFFQSFNDNNRGTFNFLGRNTNSPFADILLGLQETSTRQIGATPAYLFSTNYGLFFQDDYKIAPRLTINLGLRYELIKPPVEKYGRIAGFEPSLDQVLIAGDSTIPDLAAKLASVNLQGKVDVARNHGLPSSLVYTKYRNFAPRVGLAWRPFGGARTVIRTGYGIFYGSTLQNPVRNDLANVFPFTEAQTFNRVTATPGALSLSSPFPDSRAAFTNILNANGFETHAPSPYMQGYNLTVDHEIGASTVIEAAYVGSRGVHLGRRYDLNQPFRETALKLPNGMFPRPYNGFNTINYYSFGSSSNYNAGQFSLRRRFRRGLFYGFNYTYSKSIDDASQVTGNAAGGYPGAQDSRNLRLERGRSDFDVRHAFTMNWSWELPGARNLLVHGWQVAGTGRAYSGAPFTPRVANVNLNLGEANRPDRIANGALAHPSVQQWFDRSAFPLVPQNSFRFGNSGRNILDAPGFVDFNVALFRNFSVGERGSLQFRVEAFNVLNHTNFRLPNVDVDTLQGGTITVAEAARQIQLGARFRF